MSIEIKIRGNKYSIQNSSDLLLAKLVAGMRNSASEPDDDAKLAYAISRAIPGIPEALAYYKNKDDFYLALDITEIAIITVYMNIAILQRSKLQNPDIDKATIQRKIKDCYHQIEQLQKGLSSEQIKSLYADYDLPSEEVIEVASTSLNFDEDEYEDDEVKVLKAKILELEKSRL